MLACFLVVQRHLPAAAAAECVRRASPNCIRSAAQLACVAISRRAGPPCTAPRPLRACAY